MMIRSQWPMHDLSVNIVNWNTRDLLLECLQLLYGVISGLAFDVSENRIC